MLKKCPNCPAGFLRCTEKEVKGYPVEECNNCNTFALLPVVGLEPPSRMILRSLHEQGCEPGKERP